MFSSSFSFFGSQCDYRSLYTCCIIINKYTKIICNLFFFYFQKSPLSIQQKNDQEIFDENQCCQQQQQQQFQEPNTNIITNEKKFDFLSVISTTKKNNETI